MNRQVKNIQGQQFGRLRVLAFDSVRNGYAYWKCLCACGTETVIRSQGLCSGKTQSCGCFCKEQTSKAHLSHGDTVGRIITCELRAYYNAKARCECPTTGSYRYYGARGIKFCFASFQQFLSEVWRKPTPEHSIERIDNDGNYEPGNVRWATRSEQRRNRRDYAA